MTVQTILRTLIAASESGWGAIALKATVAMLATMLLIRVAHRVSASLRHLVVASTFGVLLFLPLAAALMPARVVTVPAPTIDRPAAVATPATVVRATPSADSGAVATRPRIDVIRLAYGVYGAGAFLLVLSLGVGIWRVHRIRHTALVSVEATRLANEAARAQGLPGGIEVAVSSRLAVPITMGATHPVILLPAETEEWSEEELARAIRHEIEHVARGDWTTQIVSRLACALYWPHPFVWVLWQRLRLEAERACDDAVILRYGSAAPYADQLVSLARRLMGRGSVPALAMATRSNLGVRVDAILDSNRRRGPLTRLGSVTVVIVAVACMLAAAPFQLMSATVGNHIERSEDEDRNDPLAMALFLAASMDDRETMRRLLDRGARADAVIPGDGSPLIAAARKGHVEAMRMLIDEGANVNRGVRGDGNPLIAAARGNHGDAVKFLLDSGAQIDLGVEGDGNALIMAAGDGHVAIVGYLLDRGADIEYVVNGDENPLIHASEGGQADAVRLLIRRGANVNARVWSEFHNGETSEGEWRTPLIMARRRHHDEVVKILLAAGAAQ